MTMLVPDPVPAGGPVAAPPVSALLARNGLAGIEPVPLAGDASARRYYRLEGHDLLVMEDASDPAGFSAYMRLSEHLNALGLSAPRVIDADPATSLALIEDFGNRTYAVCLGEGHDESALYRLAVDALLHLHYDNRGGNVSQPLYDLDLYLDELEIFADWFAPAVAPQNFDRTGFQECFRALWAEALAPVAERYDALVLRDFHVDNLMLLENRRGVARCGILDFQDGVLGPCEYDLVSLLQDARRDLAAGLEETLLAHYAANAPARLGSAKEIRHRHAVLGAQRHARILGVFVRLSKRDGKERYLAFLPRVLRQFETALGAAGLSGIAAFLNAELPGWQNGIVCSAAAQTGNGVSNA